MHGSGLFSLSFERCEDKQFPKEKQNCFCVCSIMDLNEAHQLKAFKRRNEKIFKAFINLSITNDFSIDTVPVLEITQPQHLVYSRKTYNLGILLKVLFTLRR